MNITFIRGLHSDYMFIDLRKALCDNDSSVCKAAAQMFDSLHPMVGSRALDDILPAMLEQLGDPEMHENALRSWAVLPYLIPHHHHPFNIPGQTVDMLCYRNNV